MDRNLRPGSGEQILSIQDTALQQERPKPLFQDRRNRFLIQ